MTDAAQYDLELVQGATYERTFRWKVDGVVQSLDGLTIKSELRAKESTDSDLLLNLADYCTVEEGDTLIRLLVPSSVTADLSPRAFRAAAWDLFLVSSDPAVDTVRLLEGAATCDPAATKVYP